MFMNWLLQRKPDLAILEIKHEVNAVKYNCSLKISLIIRLYILPTIKNVINFKSSSLCVL